MYPVATIVITTHNRPLLARRAVLSALRQTLAEIEVIVVDDGSTEPFQANHDDARLRVVCRDRPGGVCAARNAGLESARGKWITFLDDDDELRPDMAERSLRAARESRLPPPIAVLSGIEDVDGSGRTVATHLPVTMVRGSHYFLEGRTHGDFKTENTLFASVEVMKEIGGWDEAIQSWVHDDLFLRLNAVCSLQGVPAITYVLHEHDGPRRRRNMLDRANGMARTLEKHVRVFDLYPRRYAKYLGTIGVAYLKAGRWGSAIAATTRSIVRDPRQSRLWWWWLGSITGPGGLALYRAGRRWKQAVRSTYREPARTRSGADLK
jgi:glycosyltransferase involved in cell wall biosynthesis